MYPSPLFSKTQNFEVFTDEQEKNTIWKIVEKTLEYLAFLQ